MDTAQWPQEIVVKPMEEILIPISNNNTPCSNSKENNGNSNTSSLEKKIRPQKTQAVNCPRCNSTNTKFCYYNNYSFSQPRYFCKTCRRYWTEGGSLRNIPVGGGSRKNNKKTSSSNVSSSSSNSSKKQTPTSTITTTSSAHDQNPNPRMHDQGQDLNLGCFPMTNHDFKTISQLIQVPDFENSGNKSHFSALELLTGVSPRGCGNSNNSSSYMPIMYSEGFSSLPTLGFSLDGIGNSGYGSVQGVEGSGNSGRALFPFEDLKQVSSTNDHNSNNNNMEVNNRDQQGDSTGYWNGILGGGGSW